MKELKLRVWAKMQFVHQVNRFIYSDEFNSYEYHPLCFSAFFDYLVDQEIEYDELQLYTGIKDKNNTDIYEGDIVRFTYERMFGTTYFKHVQDAEIKFHNGVFGYNEEQELEVTCLDAWNPSEIEIIGNIYKNNISELEKEIDQTITNAQNKLNKILESK